MLAISLTGGSCQIVNPAAATLWLVPRMWMCFREWKLKASCVKDSTVAHDTELLRCCWHTREM